MPSLARTVTAGLRQPAQAREDVLRRVFSFETAWLLKRVRGHHMRAEMARRRSRDSRSGTGRPPLTLRWRWSTQKRPWAPSTPVRPMLPRVGLTLLQVVSGVLLCECASKLMNSELTRIGMGPILISGARGVARWAPQGLRRRSSLFPSYARKQSVGKEIINCRPQASRVLN